MRATIGQAIPVMIGGKQFDFHPVVAEPVGMGLTARQRQLLDFLRQFRAETCGRTPTLAEIGAAIGCGKSNAKARLRGLENRGYVRRTHYGRVIEVLP